MLQKLNERIQGVIAWVVILLIAITFTLFGVDYYLQSHQSRENQAVVNGQAITKQAFEVNYRRTRQQRDLSQMTNANEATLKKQVLNDMLVNTVMMQAAKKAGFDVTPEQANAAIVSIPQFQEDGHFSTERYQQALTGAMFTPESFQSEVRQGMILNQQRFAFIGSAFAIPSEVKRFVKLYMQTRDYAYLQIPASLFLNKQVVNESEIGAYYKAHQKEFITPEKVSLDFIRLSMQKIRENLKINDDDVQRYYNDNQSNFLTPAKWKVAHILFALPEEADENVQNEIKQTAEEAYQSLQSNPNQFTHWVQTMSADKLSVSNEGVLPWIAAGQTEFDKALSTLTKPGQISAPFKTAHGYEIFKLIAYKPATLRPLDSVKSQILEQLKTEMAQTRYTQLLEQLTDLSYQTPDSLSAVGEALKLPIEHTELFSRNGGATEITKNKQIVNAAFSHDVLELGNNSEPVQLDNDSVVVLRVKTHIPAVAKPLTEVKEAIINKLAQQMAEKTAKDIGNAALKADAKKLLSIIKEKKLAWHEIVQATRDSDKADAIINDLAFSIPKAGSQDGRSLVNGDYVIVKLKNINDGQYQTLDKEQQASITQQIEASYGLMDYDLYVNSLVSKAKIERH